MRCELWPAKLPRLIVSEESDMVYHHVINKMLCGLIHFDECRHDNCIIHELY